MITGNPVKPRLRWSALTLLLFALWPSLSPAHTWHLASLESELPDTDFTDRFRQRVLGIATVVSDDGNVFGTYLLPDESIHSFNIKFGENPAYTLFDNPDFIHLAAGEADCFWFACVQEMPFGLRVSETDALTHWLNGNPDSSPLPGSLPLARFPGSFVEENAQGVVASTQTSTEGQFSAVLNDNPARLTTMPEIAWVIALGSGEEPLVLGFRGDGGDCIVYGEGCQPPECDDEQDRHQNTRGVGHREHGRGYGYGHYKHHCHHEHDIENSDPGEPVLIRALSDGSYHSWSFPRQLANTSAWTEVESPFPLTMNDDSVILRASVTQNGNHYENRLFLCDLSGGIDLNGDGVVDCDQGLRPVEPLPQSSPVDTVLGFSLNNAGLLLGNFGFNAAGIGRPFYLDLAATAPTVTPLHNVAANSDYWELNTVTDLNRDGKAVGYGHRNCSDQPEPWSLYPAVTDTAPALALDQLPQPRNGAVAPGEHFTPAVSTTGGSGQYQYRIQAKTPTRERWQPVHDWQAQVGAVTAPRDYLGDFCLHVSARDSNNTDLSTDKVIRLRVTDAPLEAGNTPRSPELLGDREPSEPLEELDFLGVWQGWMLLLLTLAGLVRRHF